MIEIFASLNKQKWQCKKKSPHSVLVWLIQMYFWNTQHVVLALMRIKVWQVTQYEGKHCQDDNLFLRSA